jgi:hypothetical protein
MDPDRPDAAVVAAVAVAVKRTGMQVKLERKAEVRWAHYITGRNNNIEDDELGPADGANGLPDRSRFRT